MAAVTIKNRQWDVDVDGCAVVINPGFSAPTPQKVPSVRMDKAIDRLTKQKERITAERDACQAKLDEVTQKETDMIALRATVTAEP